MCLGTPGRVVAFRDDHEHLARVDVDGSTREVNIALVDDLRVGDWVLIHLGFAMERLTEEDARQARRGLELLRRTGEQEGAP